MIMPNSFMLTYHAFLIGIYIYFLPCFWKLLALYATITLTYILAQLLIHESNLDLYLNHAKRNIFLRQRNLTGNWIFDYIKKLLLKIITGCGFNLKHNQYPQSPLQWVKAFSFSKFKIKWKFRLVLIYNHIMNYLIFSRSHSLCPY